MTPRLARLRTWWASARSTVVESTWEARVWAVVGLAGVAWRPLAASVPAVFFMSAWANAKAARIQRGEAEREMLQEEADEATPA